MGFKLYRINRKVDLYDLRELIEYKFVYNKMVNELDDPFVLNMYLLGEIEVQNRSYGAILNTVEQVKSKITDYCIKYKLNSLDELEFEILTDYSKRINKGLAYGMYCMIKHGRLHNMPNFTKYLPQDKLESLGNLAIDAIQNSQNITYVPEQAPEILEEIKELKSRLDSVWDNLIVSWDDTDMHLLFRLTCVNPDELGLSLYG